MMMVMVMVVDKADTLRILCLALRLQNCAGHSRVLAVEAGIRPKGHAIRLCIQTPQ